MMRTFTATEKAVIDRARASAEETQDWNRMCDEIAAEVLSQFAWSAVIRGFTAEQRDQAFDVVLNTVGLMAAGWLARDLEAEAEARRA